MNDTWFIYTYAILGSLFVWCVYKVGYHNGWRDACKRALERFAEESRKDHADRF